MKAIHCTPPLVLTLCACLLLTACSKDTPEKAAPTKGTAVSTIPVVYTVNYPLKYFAERIGGRHIKAVFPSMDGDPAFWQPDAQAIQAFQTADLILLNGAAYAKWVNMATLPEEKLVNTSNAFKDRYIKLEDAVTHSHGPEGEHEHTGTAFTTWLDFSLAVEHGRAIREALTSLMPDRKEAFQKSCDALAKELNALDQKIKNIVAEKKDQPLVASHPVYQYFTRRYGLNMKSVHFEPDEAPDAIMWAELEKLLADHPAEWMIWESHPMDEVVKRLEEMGIKSLVFNPCGNAPEDGDFLGTMNQNLENLKAAF